MNKKSIRFLKNLFFLLAILVAFFFIIFSILARDISDEELAPFPFTIDESISAEDNPELKQIVEIAKKIQGLEEFKEQYVLDPKNPLANLKMLEDFLLKNKEVINNLDLDLFRKCKFPKPNLEGYSHQNAIVNIGILLNGEITFNIYSQDYEKAKNNILKLNQINRELINKPTSIMDGMIVMQCMNQEVRCILLFIEQEIFTSEQKLNILNIKHVQFSNQTIKTISFFGTEFIKKTCFELIKNSEANSNFFGIKYSKKNIDSTLGFQPNKTVKIYRDYINAAISDFENIPNDSRNILLKSYLKRNISLPINGYGKIFLNMELGAFNIFFEKMIRYNNRYNQLLVAKEIIAFKIETGELPNSLEELKIEKKVYKDILTNEPFIYFPENGILQSIGGNKINNCEKITEKELSTKEIRDILNEDSYKDDFILYLK